MSKCNYCWQDMQGDSSVAPCGHVFCSDHADAMLEQGEGCLVCGSSVAHSTLKVVPLEPPPSLLEGAMRGLCPAAIALAAKAGIEWWTLQTEFTNQHLLNMKDEYCVQREMKFKQKLTEVHDAYKKARSAEAKNKAAQMLLDNEALSKDRDELHQKFEAKCREKRKVEETMQMVLAENQQLKSAGHRMPSSALQQHEAQHEAALMAAAQLHGGSMRGGGGGGGPLLPRSGGQISHHHFATHTAPMAPPPPADTTFAHTRSIHAASTQRYDYAPQAGHLGVPPVRAPTPLMRPASSSGFAPGSAFNRLGSVPAFRTSPAGGTYSEAPRGYDVGGMYAPGVQQVSPLGGMHQMRPSPMPSPQRQMRGAQYGSRFPV